MKKPALLIVSPQEWGHLFISKHNYARAFAAWFEVYYFSPGNTGNQLVHFGSAPIQLIAFPWFRRFTAYPRLRPLLGLIYSLLLKWRFRREKPMLTIDFGCQLFFKSMAVLPGKRKIWFPVDDFNNLPLSARGAERVYTVSLSIMEKLKPVVPRLSFKDHGVNPDFIAAGRKQAMQLETGTAPGAGMKPTLQIGYAGNPFIPYLDRAIFRELITHFEEHHFHIYGSLSYNAGIAEEREWFKFLTAAPNVTLHGFKDPALLSAELAGMDILLLLYKKAGAYALDNSHKFLEYLSLGKVIISTPIERYRELKTVVFAPNDPQTYRDILSQVIREIDKHNAAPLQLERIRYAAAYSYTQHARSILQDLDIPV